MVARYKRTSFLNHCVLRPDLVAKGEELHDALDGEEDGEDLGPTLLNFLWP
jgi:hypothetical protein